MMKRTWKTTGYLFLLLTFCLCLGVGNQAEAAVKVKKVTAKSNLGTKNVYVAKGKKVKLTPSISVNPNTKANQKLKFKSANKKIATVSGKGVIKGKKAGKTKVTVTSAKNKKKKAVVSVQVMKKAVKKVALTKSSASLPAGSSITLKTKITASKGACKKVYWETSNKKVATVTKKGVVKGVAVGTADITAVAADGSGKKATCKVTVTEPANSIMSLGVYNPGNKTVIDTLQFTLTQAQALTAADIVVKTKSDAKAQYNTSESVSSIITSDNKTYMISLRNQIENGTYIMISISSLTGNKSMEILFKAAGKDTYTLICGTVGEYLVRDLTFSNLLGAVTMKRLAGVMPGGLSLDAQKGSIVGTPSALVDNKNVVILGTDEKGTTARNIINFLIGDAGHIYAENKAVGDKTFNRVYEEQDFLEYVRVTGGSGSYQVSLVNDYGGMFYVRSKVASEGAWVSSDAGTIKAGTYDLEVRFTDSQNPNLYGTGKLRVIVSPNYTIENTIKNKEADAWYSIYYQNEETGEVFECGDWKKDNDNVVRGFVPAGTYLVYIDLDTGEDVEKYILNTQVKIADNTRFTYTMPTKYAVSDKREEE